MLRRLLQRAKPLVERFPALATAYRSARDERLLREEPPHTPMGFRFAGDPTMQSGMFEPEETQVVRRLLPRVDRFINVGANVGYYCCLALGQGKDVVAFEPVPRNLQFLMRNVRANHWESRIEVYPVALSDRAGLIEIYGGGTGASLLRGWAGTPEDEVTLVPATTLDNVLRGRFDGERCLILVDVEGAEGLMLRGAASVLGMSPKPVWMMEITVTEHQPKGTLLNPNLLSTFGVFWANGYESWTADGRCRAVLPVEVEQIVTTGIDTLGTHNFLFIEQGKKDEFLN